LISCHNGVTLGSGHEIKASASQCILVGNDDIIGTGNGTDRSENFIVGNSSEIGDLAFRCAIFGGTDSTRNTIATTCTDVSIVGGLTGVGQGSTFVTSSGNANTIGQDVENAVLSGFNLTVSDSCTEVVLSGYSLSLTTAAQSQIVNIGSTNLVRGSSPDEAVSTRQIVVVGALNTVGDINANTQFATVLGSDNSVGEGGDRLVIVGASNLYGINAEHSLMVGFGNTITDGTQYTIIVGNSSSVGSGNTVANILIGRQITQGDSSSSGVLVGDILSGGSGGDFIIVIGRQCTVGNGSGQTQVIGYQSTVGDDSSAHVFGNFDTVGNTVTNAIAAGDHVAISNTCTEVVLLGYSVSLTTTEQSKIVNIGSGNIVQGSAPDEAVRTEKIIVVGALNAVGNTTNNSSHLTVLGSDNSVGQGTGHLVVAGDDLTIPDDCVNSACIGTSNTLGLAANNTALMGSHLTTSDTCSEVVLLGYNSGLTMTGQTKIVSIGSGNTVQGPSSLKVTVVGAGNNVGDTLQVASSNTVVGCDNDLGPGTSLTTCLGATNSISMDPTASIASNMVLLGDNNRFSGTILCDNDIAVGTSNVISDMAASVIVGQRNNITGGLGGSNLIVIGDQNASGTVSFSIVMGNQISLPTGAAYVVALGSQITIGAGLGSHGGILLGRSANITATNNIAIAIGSYAEAGESQCVIGRSDVALATSAIHQFIVRGLDTGASVAIDTLNVIDNPADGSTGLTLVYNAGGTYANKTVKAAETPVAGSLLLYIDP